MEKEEISLKVEENKNLEQESLDLNKLEEPFQEIQSKSDISLAVESEEEVFKESLKPKKQDFKRSWKDKIKQKTTSFLKNPWNLGFLVVLFLGIAIRLKYFNMESIWNDAAVHLWYAIKVTKEPLFMFSRDYLLGDHVVPQTITAFYYLFTKNAFIAGKLMALTYSVIGIIFMYLLGTEMKNKFFGLIATILFTFNHLFWFYGVRPLADAPLTVMVVLLLYSVVKLEKTKTLFWGITSAVVFILAMATKQQAIIFFFAYFLYLVIFKHKDMFQKANLISYGFPLFLIFLGSLIFKYNYLASFVTRILRLVGTEDGFLFVYSHLQWIFGSYLLVLVSIGLILVFFLQSKNFYLPSMFFVVYAIYLELGINNVEDRIVLPLLSVGILLVVYVLSELGSFTSIVFKNKKFVFPIVLILAFIFAWQSFNLGDPLIAGKENGYAGHLEAGEWIKDNVPQEAVVFAGSPRMVRAFTEREFGGPDYLKRYGGNLWWLRHEKYLDNKSAFEQDLKMLARNHEIYLEIDVWEYTQPKWYFPIQQDSINQFIGLEFQLVKMIEREVSTNQGQQKIPVIFLFKYKPN
jgi:hypothetical protein